MVKVASLYKAAPEGDEELLVGLQAGDRIALEHVYSSCFPLVERLVEANSGSSDEAKDIFQEAMMVLYDKLQRDGVFSLNCKLSTYLYAISRRLWLKSLRVKGRYTTEDFLQSEDSLSDEVDADLTLHVEKENQFQLMERSLQELGSPCSQILLSFYMDGKSMQTISEELGYTNAENVKNQKYKCLQRLKKIYFKTR